MSVRKRKWFELAAIIWAAGAVLVGTAYADEAYDRCLEDSDGTNAAWSECGGEYLSRLDGGLNDAWQQVFPQLTPEGKTLLRAEQRDWNKFKEGSCLYYGNGDYGREGQVLHLPICRGEIIEQRIQYLQTLGDFVAPEVN